MALQDGIIKIKGTLGDINFVKTQDGYIARLKGGVDGNRIKNDPRFVRTRENGAEFGRAGKAAKVLRKALRALILRVADNRSTSRLMKEFMKALQADTVNPRGERTVNDGEVGFLKGFELNINARLEATFVAPYTTTINRLTGATAVNIPAFDPVQSIIPPAGATHCRFMCAGSTVDFEQEVHGTGTTISNYIDLKAVQQPLVSMENLVAPNSTLPIFVSLGIEFFQNVNGVYYALSNGAYNALAIVAVDSE